MAEVTMYYSETCPFCKNAEKLLEKKGVSINKICIDDDDEALEAMKKRSNRDTVPQIFIDDKHIGGFDDLSELDMDDELDPLLQ